MKTEGISLKQTEKQDAINNSPVFHMSPADPSFVALKTKLYETAFAYFCKQHLKGVKEDLDHFGWEYDCAFRNCFENYDPSRGLFLPYLMCDVSMRIQTTVRKDWERTSRLAYPAANPDEDIADAEAMERLLYGSGDCDVLYLADNNPEIWYARKDSYLCSLRKLENAFNTLQNRSKPVISAWLTGRIYESATDELLEDVALTEFSFFDPAYFAECVAAGKALTQRELAEKLGVFEGNVSRSVLHFKERLGSGKKPTGPVGTEVA